MKSNRTQLIKDLTQVYLSNRSVNWMLNSSSHERVEVMIKYLLKAANSAGGIVLSDDERLAAVYLHRKKDFLGRLKEFIWINIFIKYVICSDCASKFKAHQKYLRHQYPDKEIMQVVLLSVTPKTITDMRMDKVMRNLIEVSEREKKPIYLETSAPPLIPFFEKYGFEMYHEWDRGVTNFPLWLYKRECKNMALK